MQGTSIGVGQRRLLECLCNDRHKCAVVVHHQSVVEPVVKMVGGWSQTVSEFWFNGEWQTLDDEMNLKDFVNAFFKTVCGYEEDVVV